MVFEKQKRMKKTLSLIHVHLKNKKFKKGSSKET